jgi:hypothetical protein
MSDGLSSERAALRHIVGRLAEEFGGIFSRETVERVVGDHYEGLSVGARVTSFLLILAERFARDQLRMAARHEAHA